MRRVWDFRKKDNSFASYIQRRHEHVLPHSVRLKTFVAYPLSRQLLEAIPDLKEYIGEWNVIVESEKIFILPCDCDEWSEAKNLFGPYFGHQLKGFIRYLNISFLVIYTYEEGADLD